MVQLVFTEQHKWGVKQFRFKTILYNISSSFSDSPAYIIHTVGHLLFPLWKYFTLKYTSFLGNFYWQINFKFPFADSAWSPLLILYSLLNNPSFSLFSPPQPSFNSFNLSLKDCLCVPLIVFYFPSFRQVPKMLKWEMDACHKGTKLL